MAVVTEAKIKVAINGFGRIGACAMRSRMITLSHVARAMRAMRIRACAGDDDGRIRASSANVMGEYWLYALLAFAVAFVGACARCARMSTSRAMSLSFCG